MTLLFMIANLFGQAMPDEVTNPQDMDLYLLIGQSNMSGRGEVTGQDRLPVEGICVLNKAMDWANQGEPIH
jgi:hypothetical protein